MCHWAPLEMETHMLFSSVHLEVGQKFILSYLLIASFPIFSPFWFECVNSILLVSFWWFGNWILHYYFNSSNFFIMLVLIFCLWNKHILCHLDNLQIIFIIWNTFDIIFYLSDQPILFHFPSSSHVVCNFFIISPFSVKICHSLPYTPSLKGWNWSLFFLKSMTFMLLD